MAGPELATCRPILVVASVRCVGDRVAFVVAETLAQARRGRTRRDRIRAVEAVTNSRSGQSGRRIWDECPGGISRLTQLRRRLPTTEQAFSRARTWSGYGLRTIASPPTPWSRAWPSAITIHGGSYTLHTSSQNSHGVRSSPRGMSCIAGNQDPRDRARRRRGLRPEKQRHLEDPLVLWARAVAGVR